MRKFAHLTLLLPVMFVFAGVIIVNKNQTGCVQRGWILRYSFRKY